MKSFNKLLRYLKSIIFFGIIQNITNLTIEEVRSCIKEIIYSYYMRGINVQYGPKGHFFSPEEATRQNLNYLTCAFFANSVYLELINTTFWGHNTYYYAKKYIGKRPEVLFYGTKINSKELEVKYYAPGEENNYKTVINPDFQLLISLVEIGDILNTPDHTLIIYDIIKDEKGNKVDAILIHSMSGSGVRYIRVKVPRYYTESPTGKEYKSEHYTIFLKESINKKFDEGVVEATLNAVHLSKYYMWCDLTQPPKASNYTIIRPIQVNDKNQPIFKFIKSSEDHYKSKYKDNNQ